MGINVVLALMVIGSFLLAIPLHECGHALMASLLGDRTPREEGRLSLSIRTHIDPIGLLMCLILAFQPGFGMGFERLVQFITGSESCLNCVEYPRNSVHYMP